MVITRQELMAPTAIEDPMMIILEIADSPIPNGQ